MTPQDHRDGLILEISRLLKELDLSLQDLGCQKNVRLSDLTNDELEHLYDEVFLPPF